MTKHYPKPTKATKMVDGDSCIIQNEVFDVEHSIDHTCYGCFFYKNTAEDFCVKTNRPPCSYDGYSIIFLKRDSSKFWEKYVAKFADHQKNSPKCAKIVAEFIHKESMSDILDFINEHKDGWNGDVGKFAQMVSAVLTTVKNQLYHKK